MRIVGLDISKNWIGVAFYEKFLETYKTINTKKSNVPMELKKIKDILKPDCFFIGLATHIDKNLTDNGKYIKNFVHSYRKNIFNIPFKWINETYTTQLVCQNTNIKQKESHQFAAAFIIAIGLEKFYNITI